MWTTRLQARSESFMQGSYASFRTRRRPAEVGPVNLGKLTTVRVAGAGMPPQPVRMEGGTT